MKDLKNILEKIEALKNKLEENNILVEKAEPPSPGEVQVMETEFILPKFTPSDKWGVPSDDVKSERKRVERLLGKIKGESFEKKIEYIDKLFKECSNLPEDGTDCDADAIADDVSEILARLVFLETMSSIIYDYEASAGGFLLESFLAALFGGDESRQVPTGKPNVIDFFAQEGEEVVGYSLKLLKDQGSHVEGSELNLIRDLIRHGKPVNYLVGLKRRTPGQDEVFRLDFYKFTVGAKTPESKEKIFKNLDADGQVALDDPRMAEPRSEYTNLEKKRIQTLVYKRFLDNTDEAKREMLARTSGLFKTSLEDGSEIEHNIQALKDKPPGMTSGFLKAVLKSEDVQDLGDASLDNFQLRRDKKGQLNLFHNPSGVSLGGKNPVKSVANAVIDAHMASETVRRMIDAKAQQELAVVTGDIQEFMARIDAADVDFLQISTGTGLSKAAMLKLPGVKDRKVSLTLGSKQKIQELANNQISALENAFNSAIVPIYNSLNRFSNAINDYFLDEDRLKAGGTAEEAKREFENLQSAVKKERGLNIQENKKGVEITRSIVLEIIKEEVEIILNEIID